MNRSYASKTMANPRLLSREKSASTVKKPNGRRAKRFEDIVFLVEFSIFINNELSIAQLTSIVVQNIQYQLANALAVNTDQVVISYHINAASLVDEIKVALLNLSQGFVDTVSAVLALASSGDSILLRTSLKAAGLSPVFSHSSTTFSKPSAFSLQNVETGSVYEVRFCVTLSCLSLILLTPVMIQLLKKQLAIALQLNANQILISYHADSNGAVNQLNVIIVNLSPSSKDQVNACATLAAQGNNGLLVCAFEATGLPVKFDSTTMTVSKPLIKVPRFSSSHIQGNVFSLKFFIKVPGVLLSEMTPSIKQNTHQQLVLALQVSPDQATLTFRDQSSVEMHIYVDNLNERSKNVVETIVNLAIEGSNGLLLSVLNAAALPVFLQSTTDIEVGLNSFTTPPSDKENTGLDLSRSPKPTAQIDPPMQNHVFKVTLRQRVSNQLHQESQNSKAVLHPTPINVLRISTSSGNFLYPHPNPADTPFMTVGMCLKPKTRLDNSARKGSTSSVWSKLTKRKDQKIMSIVPGHEDDSTTHVTLTSKTQGTNPRNSVLRSQSESNIRTIPRPRSATLRTSVGSKEPVRSSQSVGSPQKQTYNIRRPTGVTSPGPGHYKVKSAAFDDTGFTLGGRTPMYKIRNDTPGPGTYYRHTSPIKQRSASKSNLTRSTT